MGYPRPSDSPLVRDYVRRTLGLVPDDLPDAHGPRHRRRGRDARHGCPGATRLGAGHLYRGTEGSGQDDAVHPPRVGGGARSGVGDAGRSWVPGGRLPRHQVQRRTHVLLSATPHRRDGMAPRERRPFQLVPHLRNDDLVYFRWGDPTFARTTLEKIKGLGTIGFVEGSEIDIPGPDLQHTGLGEIACDMVVQVREALVPVHALGSARLRPR